MPKKAKQLNFLVTPELAALLRALQEKRGDSFKLSGWLREIVTQAVQRELTSER